MKKGTNKQIPRDKQPAQFPDERLAQFARACGIVGYPSVNADERKVNGSGVRLGSAQLEVNLRLALARFASSPPKVRQPEVYIGARAGNGRYPGDL